MLFAGFDAGQTRTRCRISRWTTDGWMTVCEGQGSGVCHLEAPDGVALFRDAVGSSLQAALGQRDAMELDAVVIGASGIEQGTALQQRAGDLIAQELVMPPEHVLATGDERTALRGAFPDSPGIVLISGTGAIAVGRDASGRQHRCAGWGWLVDGVGSAMDIGRDGLALTLRMADGRLEETALKTVLWEALGVHEAHELKARVVDPSFGAAGFARLAPLVSAQAEAGDPHAGQVLEIAGEELALMVEGVASALALDAPALCCFGGAISHLAPLQQAMEVVLQERLPGIRRVQAKGDACGGALQLAQALSS